MTVLMTGKKKKKKKKQRKGNKIPKNEAKSTLQLCINQVCVFFFLFLPFSFFRHCHSRLLPGGAAPSSTSGPAAAAAQSGSGGLRGTAASSSSSPYSFALQLPEHQEYPQQQQQQQQPQQLLPVPSSFNSNTVSSSVRREKGVLAQMSVLVLAFVVCWLPFWLLYTILFMCLNLQVRT